MRRIYIILLLCASVASGCYDNHSNSPTDETSADRGNCTLAQLRSLCKEGHFYTIPNGTCVGRVTSSDEEGNFYRSLYIEDESGGAEILLGLYNNHTQYPVGLEITTHLEGLAATINNGLLQIGLTPESYDISLREIEPQELIDRHIIRGNDITPIEPIRCSITELETTMCGRLIRIDGLCHSPIDEEREYYRFTDSNGEVIYAYISEYATLKPSLSANSLTGILRLETVVANEDKHFTIAPRFEYDFTNTGNIY